jgi:predicted transcriptional regulator
MYWGNDTLRYDLWNCLHEGHSLKIIMPELIEEGIFEENACGFALTESGKKLSKDLKKFYEL